VTKPSSAARNPAPAAQNPAGNGFAVGVIVAAGCLLLLIGLFHIIMGLVAVVNESFYVVGQQWTFEFDVTAWGWIHLVLGVVVVAAGVFLFRGAVWARIVGVIVAVVSAVANFAWLPYYPVWSLLIIALDVFVIWALTAHGRDIAR
jgi:hypothetical protein